MMMRSLCLAVMDAGRLQQANRQDFERDWPSVLAGARGRASECRGHQGLETGSDRAQLCGALLLNPQF